MTAVTTTPRSRNAVIGLGVLIALAGAVLLFWPDVTTLVLVSLLGLSIALYGVHELVNGFAGGSGRPVWSVIIGVVAIIGGIAVVVTPSVTTIAIGIVIGINWVIAGVICIIAAIVDPANRLLRILFGLVSIIAGLAVLAQPSLSLVVIVWLSGAWMLATGIVTVISAFLRRSRGLAPEDQPHVAGAHQ